MTNPNLPAPDRPSASDFQSFVEKIVADLERSQAEGTWAVYSRLSRVMQNVPSYSLEFQPDRAAQYAREKGAKVILTYQDGDLSGKNSRRPDLQRLIRDVKSGKVRVVVVHRLDRLYRNLESLLRIVRLFRKYQVRLMSVEEQIDTDSWWGRIVLAVLGALAEAYVWQASEHARIAKLYRLYHGLANGRIPLGYCTGKCQTCTDTNGSGYCFLFGGENLIRADSKIPVPHPIDRHVIPLIAELYARQWSFREIAAYLNTHDFDLPDGRQVKFRTKGTYRLNDPSDTREFSGDSIRVIVGNVFYTGQIAEYAHKAFDVDDDEAWVIRD
jgi:DNA invertase Pin-like site-specific DNA recombinase